MNTPLEVTNYNRTRHDKEKFWLFCLFVAGKNSDIQLKKLNQFLSNKPQDFTPFEWIREVGVDSLRNMLVASRVGQYNRLTEAIKQSLELDLDTCTVEDLENIYGVGGKTARFFILHTRKDAECAVLDTHILKWLQDKGFDVPDNTPNDKHYKRIENLALTLMKQDFPHLTIAEADLFIWAMKSGRLE